MDSAVGGGSLGLKPSAPVPNSLRRNPSASGNLAIAQIGQSGITQNGAHFCLDVGLRSLKTSRVLSGTRPRAPQPLQLLLLLVDPRVAGIELGPQLRNLVLKVRNVILEVCNLVPKMLGLVPNRH
jgi:hypothetical protein